MLSTSSSRGKGRCQGCLNLHSPAVDSHPVWPDAYLFLETSSRFLGYTHPGINKFIPSSVGFLFFYVNHLLKSLLNLLQYSFCFMFCFQGLEECEDLSFPTRDQTPTSALEGEVLTTGLPGSEHRTLV